MERRVKVVCSIVAFLGILSALIGFAAEAIRIMTDSELYSRDECTYGSPLSVLLGLIGVVILVISQIVLNVSAGCICGSKSPSLTDSNWGVAVISFILFWLTCVSAILLWLTAMLFGNFGCYGYRAGVFAGGAILALANSAFGIVYYLTSTASRKNGSIVIGDLEGIAMGQPRMPRRQPIIPHINQEMPQTQRSEPQIPQVSQDPVFVHEDTYVRRQFT